MLLEKTASAAIPAQLSKCNHLHAAVLPGSDGGQVGVMQQSGPQDCLPLLHLGQPLPSHLYAFRPS